MAYSGTALRAIFELFALKTTENIQFLLFFMTVCASLIECRTHALCIQNMPLYGGGCAASIM